VKYEANFITFPIITNDLHINLLNHFSEVKYLSLNIFILVTYDISLVSLLLRKKIVILAHPVYIAK